MHSAAVQIAWVPTTLPDQKIAARLRQAREKAGFDKPTDAARSMGVKVPTYLGHENASRGVPRDRLKIYAKKFGVNLVWLMTGQGPMQGAAGAIKVAGRIGAGAEVHPFDDESPGVGPGDDVIYPVDGNGVVAARIEGESMHPFQAGWAVIYRRDAPEGVANDAIGSLAVVKVKDGPILVKVLKRDGKDRWRLESYNAPTREGVQVEWAAKVLSIQTK